MKTIAYQGVQGAFSYITALNEFGIGNNYIGKSTFREVFELLHNDEADFAVLPIENSLIGSIYENYDLLNHYDMQIVAEQYTRIEHCLLTLPCLQNGQSLKGINKVLSHPKALEQCSGFFRTHPWIKAEAYLDTAAAAAKVASEGDPSSAAIASAFAGELYGLDVLQSSIEDNPQNYTRFVTVSKAKRVQEDDDKCSLILQLNHIPGALASVLSLLAGHNMNVTKIESRPLWGSPFEYIFHIDIDFKGVAQKDMEELLMKFRSKVQALKILGFYKSEIHHG